MAVARGEVPLTDPKSWFIQNFDMEPDYSKLLEELAPAPAERMALLRGYFEPNIESRNRKIPDVIRSDDDVKGVVPLTHSKCYLIKLHGDYRDTRIKNTTEELDSYSVKINNLLDWLLDEFGLIICGWSAVWDTALRNAITRCPTRRYTTYWLAHQGQLNEEARDLIKQRRAEIINTDSANTFFKQLEEKVEALRDINRPHPLSTAVAVATVKRYLPDPQQRIRLYDLIREGLEHVKSILSSPRVDSRLPRLGQ